MRLAISSLALCATLALAAAAQASASQPASDRAPAGEEAPAAEQPPASEQPPPAEVEPSGDAAPLESSAETASPDDAAGSQPAPALEQTTGDRAHHLGPGEGAAVEPDDSTGAEEAPDMAEGGQAPADQEPPPPVVPTPLEPQPVPEIEERAPPPAVAELECPPPPPPLVCDLEEQAQPLIYGGLATGGLGLFGAIGFFLAGTAERLQAQSLLDTSEAFTEVDDRYVVQDPGHDDVGLYEDHRATASVMSQLTWISVGVALAGATTAGTAFFLSHEAEACGAAD